MLSLKRSPSEPQYVPLEMTNKASSPRASPATSPIIIDKKNLFNKHSSEGVTFIQELDRERRQLDEERLKFDNYKRVEEANIRLERQQLLNDVSRLEKELNIAIKEAQEQIRRDRTEFEIEKKELDLLKGKIGEWPLQITLKIGNHVYLTTSATLKSIPDSFLATTLASYISTPTSSISSTSSPDKEALSMSQSTVSTGEAFIDRDGTHFTYILNYLRDCKKNKTKCVLPKDRVALKQLRAEAEFYRLKDFVAMVNRKLSKGKRMRPDLYIRNEDDEM